MVIIKNSHQGAKAQRNTKEFILKKFLAPRRPGGKFFWSMGEGAIKGD